MAKKPVVKKSNALINATYSITLAEQRVVLLAAAKADGDPEELKQTYVHARDYAEQYKVTLNTAYEALHDASRHLFERRFSYQRLTEKGRLRDVVSRWVSKVEYGESEGLVKISFSDDVLPLLSDLQARFTYYELEQIAELPSIHAVRLYELLIAWRSTGKTPIIAIDDFRHRLGVGVDEYPRMSDFKRWVLDYAIAQIDKHTDIKASYKQHKRGRSISGFEFSFSLKQRGRDPNTVDWLNGKPDAGRKTISKSKAESMARPGESYHELFRRLGRDFIIKK